MFNLLKKVIMKSFLQFLLLTFLLTPSLSRSQQQPPANYFSNLVKKNAASIGLSAADLASTRISDAYYDNHTRLYMVYLQQTFKSVDVYNAISSLAFKDEKLASGKYEKNIIVEKTAKKLSGKPGLSAGSALQKAATTLGISYANNLNTPLQQSADGRRLEFEKSEELFDNAVAELKWVSDNNSNNFKLSWNISLQTKKKNAL